MRDCLKSWFQLHGRIGRRRRPVVTGRSLSTNSGMRRTSRRGSKISVTARRNRAPFLNLEFAQLLCSEVVRWASPRKLVEQRLRLLQVVRVEAFGEPAVDRSEQVASLCSFPDRARAEPCSLLRAIPRTLLVARAQPGVHARNALRPFATSGSGDRSAISPAMRWMSASYQLSLLFGPQLGLR